jgi:hypothetical protein
VLERSGIPREDWEKRTALVDPDGAGPRMFFQTVPEPKSAKNRVHLDIHVGVGTRGDERQRLLDAEAARLTGSGRHHSVAWSGQGRQPVLHHARGP